MTVSRVDPTEPLDLRAGELSVVLESGALRWLRRDQTELIRGVYVAVRDPEWATIGPRFERYDVTTGPRTFRARVAAVCLRKAGDIDFAWEASIDGRADGTVRFALEGRARRSFLKARIGLCVLHPPRLAGRGVEVRTASGTVRGRFPDLIERDAPFSRITAIRQEPGTERDVIIGLDGELFEMEDERAFGDASFKTFSTPLDLPWPVLIEAGQVVRQTVTIRSGTPAPGRQRRTSRRRARPMLGGVSVGAHIGPPLPSIGTCVAPSGVAWTPELLDALSRLPLAHLRETIELTQPDAAERLARLRTQALELKTAAEVAVVGRADDSALRPLIKELSTWIVPIARLLIFDPERHTTPRALLERGRVLAATYGLRVPIGGGSRGYFAHLNADGIPAGITDVVSFPMNPQVHVFDRESILQNAQSLPAMVRTARSLAPSVPLAIGPLSLRPLFNPDLAGPTGDPPDGALPDRYDVRQPSPFTAVWTLVCLATLADHGVGSVTMHELAGWGGLVAADQRGGPPPSGPPGSAYPVFLALQALTGTTATRTVRTDERLTAIATESAATIEVLVGNLTARPIESVVRISGMKRGADTAILGIDWDVARGATWSERAKRHGTDGEIAVTLDPHGLAMVRVYRGKTL